MNRLATKTNATSETGTRCTDFSTCVGEEHTNVACTTALCRKKNFMFSSCKWTSAAWELLNLSTCIYCPDLRLRVRGCALFSRRYCTACIFEHTHSRTFIYVQIQCLWSVRLCVNMQDLCFIGWMSWQSLCCAPTNLSSHCAMYLDARVLYHVA